jgi:hypothetical protein
MKKILFTLVCFLSLIVANAQQQTFDIIHFSAPKGWKVKTTELTTQFSKEDGAKDIFCLITLYKSIEAGGESKENFDASWTSLVKDNIPVQGEPEMQPAAEEKGWKIETGYANFEVDSTKGVALLVSATGQGKLVNVLIITNTNAYEKDITSFLETIDFKKPSADKTTSTTTTTTQKSSTPVSTGKFKFTSTNFDDGWVATEQADWVEVTKGNVKVLLHYPKNGTITQTDPEPFMNNAWNILVAPRYKNMKDYMVAKPITEYERGYLATATATDSKTGKEVFVALFRKGSSGFIEFIFQDKNAFITQYGFDPAAIRWDSDSKIWEPLVKMVDYNKFAIAASDFTGSWTSDFTGMQQLYNVYSGQYAGMSMHQTSETFDFTGKNYSWKLLAINGMVGTARFDQVKSAGTFSVPNNWQLYCSKIENKAKTFNAHFSCIKGARILWLQDAAYPSSYTQYGRK